MVTGIYQEVELSLTENLIPVTVPVKQYDNKAPSSCPITLLCSSSSR